MWEDHRPRSGVWKGTSGGDVISFSGCDDDQTSADTSVSSSNSMIFKILICPIERSGITRQVGSFFISLYLLPLQALSKITSTGAMTFCFIQAIERGQASTYGSMLNSMRNTIKNTGSDMGMGGGAVTSLITMLVTGGSLSGGLRQVNLNCPGYSFFIFTISWACRVCTVESQDSYQYQERPSVMKLSVYCLYKLTVNIL